jgi:ChrR-like protein with cupin domain
MTTDISRQAITSFLALTAESIRRLPYRDVPLCPGVTEKELWRFGSYVQALLKYEPGASTPGVQHLAAHHHTWVVEGAATIAGRRMPQGSYAHIPPEVAHPIVADSTTGCLLLQMHRPHAPQEAS